MLLHEVFVSVIVYELSLPEIYYLYLEAIDDLYSNQNKIHQLIISKQFFSNIPEFTLT